MLVIEPRGEGGITQAEIARVLGVTRTAASKMARLLEALKLVRRDHLVNRRTVSLRLTDDGKEAFHWARHQVRRPFFSQKLLELWLHEYRDPHRALGDVICDLEALAYGYRAPLVEGFVYPGPYPHPFLLSNDRLAREGARDELASTPAPPPDWPASDGAASAERVDPRAATGTAASEARRARPPTAPPPPGASRLPLPASRPSRVASEAPS